MSDASPVFLHSLFRSGSTYMFDTFRRLGSYTCYQEPFNETLLEARSNKHSLIDRDESERLQTVLRHPKLDAPYFQEFYDVHTAWAGVLTEESLYADFFGDVAPAETAAYLTALSNASPKRPFFQTCRTSLRIEAIQNGVGGVHLALWRNPWDQWLSMKASAYFNGALRVAVDAASSGSFVSELRDFLLVPRTAGKSIPDMFVFHERRPVTSRDSYRSFFATWMLSMLEAESHADLAVQIDRLSSDESYREGVVDKLRAMDVDAPSFDDCVSPQTSFSEQDEAFFRPIESEVGDWLKASGISDAATIDSLLERSRAATIVRPGVDKDARKARETIRHLEDEFSVSMGHLCHENEHLSELTSSLHEEVQQREEAIEVHRAEAEIAKAEWDKATENLHKANAEIARYNVNLNVANAEIARLAIQAEAVALLQAELEAMRNSTSWRITRPLRTAVTKARLFWSNLRGGSGPVLDGAFRLARLTSSDRKTELEETPYLEHLIEKEVLEGWRNALGATQKVGKR